jgi:RNA polymerase sigma-70 factor (ECF subfamily)
MEEIIKRNIDKMFRATLAVTRSQEDAQDAVQNAFVKLIEKQPRFESREHETAWLIRVAVNDCKNILRFNKRNVGADLLDTYPAASPEQHELVDAIGKLPAKYRLVIHLHYYEGYSTSEIAQITKQKPGTVREQLTRARRLLKQELQEE